MSFTLENIKELKDKFNSGKSALNDEELNEILIDTINLFKDITSENLASKNDEELKETKLLFESIINGEFRKLLMSKIEEESFFNLGEVLFNAGKKTEHKLIFSIAELYLNFLRTSEFLIKITEEKKWTVLIKNLIELTNFNTGKLFKQRVSEYEKKILFNTIVGDKVTPHTWNDIDEIISQYSNSLLNLLGKFKDKPRVAFLTENSLNMALLDLACLNSGIVNVMIPANSVSQHIAYILNQSKCDFIIISNEKQLVKLKSIKNEVKELKTGILLEGKSVESWVISFDKFKEAGKKETKESYKLGINDNATIMYTSGTTGEPKGIIFTQKNIVFKRFCRAIALPQINDADSFLSYLPLFHTFGRWLELMGTVFWGTQYSFMENPSAETMIANMQLVKPSIFISIPKKWMQLYENISSSVDVEYDNEEKIKEHLENVTGGSLKWGLSAAGYLPSDIFEFFQKFGVQLMSGFGMTEATGGITMTPPNNYIPNSLGKALPGIEIKLAEDGELLIKGGYVTPGYFGHSKEESFDENGWFPSGDIMKMDSYGFIEIIDRKKEIYKNIKGETIAPQRIENLFKDFEAIKQVFVVGDHRPFNTVLIYPDDESTLTKNMDDENKKEYYSNVIVTINKFLAPFERIVDFSLIDRPFSTEQGELTPKNTYKRRNIENNFSEIIEKLYEKDYYSLFMNQTEIKIPNWFLRERGCLSSDIKIENSYLLIQKLDKKLTLQIIDNHTYRIGDYLYKIERPQIDLHEFLINPVYWLGNNELFEFTDEAILQWYRQNTEDKSIKYIYRYSSKYDLQEIRKKIYKRQVAGEKSLYGLHLALVLIQSENVETSVLGFKYLETLLRDEVLEIYKIGLNFIGKPFITNCQEIQKKLLLLGIEHSNALNFKNLFDRYLRVGPKLFDSKILNEIVNNKKCIACIDYFDELLNEKVQLKYQTENLEETVIPVLLDILSRFGIRYPTQYEVVRRKLVNIQLIDDWQELSVMTREYRTKMRIGFRKWLGQNEAVAVDVETGDEYGWKDVLIFEEDIEKEEIEFLTNCISKTSILREAVFLFSKGNIIRLSNILPRGVWISKFSETEKYNTYKVTIQTRHQGSFYIMLHQNKNRTPDEIFSEINWLILAGSRYFMTELIEDFGGYWENYETWTQEYLSGLTVEQLFTRDIRKDSKETEEKYSLLWSFFIWNAAAAYINFWRLTSGKMQLTNPTPDNLIIPSHDYQLGTRFVSLSQKSEFKSYTDLFCNFYKKFVVPFEEKYPFIKRGSAWKYIFPGLINAEGENEGIEILNCFLIELSKNKNDDKEKIINELNKLLKNIKENGYIPKQLYFAIKRFLRWNNLNNDASINAQAKMLMELYETYNLVQLENYYPETRTRFYLETVFKESDERLKKIINSLSQLQHLKQISKDEFLNEISRIQNEFQLNEKETFFLTRLSYPHLKPTDSASFAKPHTEGEQSANLVVQVEDTDGNQFYIRKPISPKEISKLYQLFIDTNLQVSFKPDHNFLIAISDRGSIIGGLFYSYLDNEVVHMEKIVVSNRVRRRGVSELIMNEFFSRMKDEGFQFVTTGFFRPEYFYRFGFKIEKKYSGLVKNLD